MKKTIVVRQIENRVYIRQVYLNELKPLLELFHIDLYETQEGKHTGVPRHYISALDLFRFIESTKDDYIIKII